MWCLRLFGRLVVVMSLVLGGVVGGSIFTGTIICTTGSLKYFDVTRNYNGIVTNLHFLDVDRNFSKKLISLHSTNFLSYSPNERYLVYGINQKDNENIAITDLQTHFTFVLEIHEYSDYLPTWSPNGAAIAYVSSNFYNNQKSINIAKFELTIDDRPSLFLQNQINLPNSPIITDLKWSPDSNWIALQVTDGVSGDIWIADANGLENIKMISTKEYSDDNFDWSPDSRKIIFNSYVDDNWDLLTADLDGNVENLTRTPQRPEMYPVWVNQQQIIYTSVENLYLMELNQFSVQRLTNERFAQTSAKPVWSLDGKKFIFLSGFDFHYQLVLLDLTSQIEYTLRRDIRVSDPGLFLKTSTPCIEL
jgi:Tol biopolymer transport system component